MEKSIVPVSHLNVLLNLNVREFKSNPEQSKVLMYIKLAEAQSVEITDMKVL